jgi:tryptophan 2,3-dioxygenase
MKAPAGAAETNTYARYLQLKKLLSAQITRTQSEDELLFIIMHQSHELWFKLAIHELECATRALMEGEAGPDCLMAFKRLSRVTEIQRLLIESWDVLTTLTPDEFHLFRETVGRDGASGFQSVQYRLFEYRLGLKYREIVMQTPEGERTLSVVDQAETAQDRAALEAALGAPSIYDAAVDFMSRLPFSTIEPRRDYSERYRRRTRCSRHGGTSTSTATAHQNCTSSARSSWTSKTHSAAGALPTSPRCRGSSALPPAPADPWAAISAGGRQPADRGAALSRIVGSPQRHVQPRPPCLLKTPVVFDQVALNPTASCRGAAQRRTRNPYSGSGASRRPGMTAWQTARIRR